MEKQTVTGRIFDIKRNATDDGPGVRTLVFLKGCALRCKWCANPESQSFDKQVMYYNRKCRGCGKCLEVCPVGAIRRDEKFGLLTTDACVGCGKCVDACLYTAREMMGTDMTVEEVMEIVRKDRAFYANSGGGMTLSGGEPFLQKEFTLELLKAAKAEGINTGVETCGYCPYESIQPALPYIDYLFYDVKHFDRELHKEWTGADNEQIQENLARICGEYRQGKLTVRIPFIPGANGDDDTQRGIYRYLKTLPNVQEIEILPFHRFGAGKYAGLGRNYMFDGLQPVKKNSIAYLKEIGAQEGVKIHIDAE